MSRETVVLATFRHRHEAELARGYLTEADIPAAVSADDGGGVFGAPLTFSPHAFATVTVRRVDEQRARAVLESAGILPEGSPEG